MLLLLLLGLGLLLLAQLMLMVMMMGVMVVIAVSGSSCRQCQRIRQQAGGAADGAIDSHRRLAGGDCGGCGCCRREGRIARMVVVGGLTQHLVEVVVGDGVKI